LETFEKAKQGLLKILLQVATYPTLKSAKSAGTTGRTDFVADLQAPQMHCASPSLHLAIAAEPHAVAAETLANGCFVYPARAMKSDALDWF
jgi:hypothetical protein